MASFTKIILVALFFICCIETGFAQRYNFEQYDIEDGLVQSQVTSITQDKQKRLWIATLGGLSCFNGNQFINFGKTNGLNSNFIYSICLDTQKNLFIGSERGLSRYNGNNFQNYKALKDWATKLTTSATGTIYGISGKNLFKTNGNKVEIVNVTKDTAEIITALTKDLSGRIWASVYRHGLHYLEGNKWQLKSLDKKIDSLIVTDFLIDEHAKDKIWLLTTQGIYIAENGMLTRAYAEIIKRGTAICQDEKGNLWLGTNKGAWYISKRHSIHFNAKNGFTDNAVKKIFRDVEHNIWLGSDGAGIFKFKNKSYVTFDESQGLQNNIVMSIVNGPHPDEVWMGTYDGLFVHKNKQIKKMLLPSDNEDTRRINILFRDSQHNIWIGTVDGGLWVYQKKRFKRIDHGNHSFACNVISEDSNKNIWISTNFGCFVLNEKAKKITKVTTLSATSLLEIANNYMIIGTQNGVYLVRNKKHIIPLKLKPVSGSSILSMLKYREHVLFGTADNGLIIWNITTGKLKHLTTKDGLSSDHIYSLLLDKKGVIWAGTGRGVNRLTSKDFHLLKNENKNILLVECNQNAILEDQENIWIGTTKGAIVYHNNLHPSPIIKPYIFINSAGILSQNKKGDQNNLQITYAQDELNKKIILPYHHNHLNINFTGIYLTDPKAVLYKYRLIGLDTKYSRPNINSSVNYTALPPGKYTFQVKAITTSGIESANTAAFDFEITPPYYQTTIFKVLSITIVVLLILLSVYTIINLNERQRKLRLKIKLEEQFKIRKQTAEDFHDDLGNKLTRISVLSEVLNSMIDKNDSEKRVIIQKIKSNVNELYTGTKDILWSLNPKNDTLSELLSHISEFGHEMFNETPIHFEEDTFINNIERRLPLEVSRNILMIFKEAIHNALKYAKADHIKFTANISNSILQIQLSDNGTGFDIESAKNGHGINNMQVRAKRINGILYIISNHTGTTITLSVKFKVI